MNSILLDWHRISTIDELEGQVDEFWVSRLRRQSIFKRMRKILATTLLPNTTGVVSTTHNPRVFHIQVFVHHDLFRLANTGQHIGLSSVISISSNPDNHLSRKVIGGELFVQSNDWIGRSHGKVGPRRGSQGPRRNNRRRRGHASTTKQRTRETQEYHGRRWVYRCSKVKNYVGRQYY